MTTSRGQPERREAGGRQGASENAPAGGSHPSLVGNSSARGCAAPGGRPRRERIVAQQRGQRTLEEHGQLVARRGQVVRLAVHAVEAVEGQAGQEVVRGLGAAQHQACREAAVVLRHGGGGVSESVAVCMRERGNGKACGKGGKEGAGVVVVVLVVKRVRARACVSMCVCANTPSQQQDIRRTAARILRALRHRQQRGGRPS